MPTAEKDNWTSEEVAAVGQLLLDISQQIARELVRKIPLIRIFKNW